MKQTFGDKLRVYRREANISQRELAAKTGIDFSYISKLENDRIPPPSADTIVKICEVLGINPDELLAITGKLPSDVRSGITTREGAQRFLREAQELSLSDEEWEAMVRSLRKLRKS